VVDSFDLPDGNEKIFADFSKPITNLFGIVLFPVDLYFAAIAGALTLTWACLPLWRRWCVRTNLVDDPGHRKIHSKPIPLAGGLAVMTGILSSLLIGLCILWLIERFGGDSSNGSGIRRVLGILDNRMAHPLTYGLGKRGFELVGILGGALGMLLVGWIDDKYELRAGGKFLMQGLIAFMVALAGVRITLFVPSLAFSYVITVLWILTVINAFNFMDNMNGLCGGLGAIGAWYFAMFAAREGHYLVALIAFLTFGALLGFLPWNFPEARVFLGDAGSHLVGYLLAVLAILPHFHSAATPRPWAVVLPLLVLALPLADMAWVVVLRWRMGKPFYIGDTNHLSHRLARAGLGQRLSVLLIWLMATFFGGLAFWL
jgi:UDP-GlcNAc:undecaprenyl-phosphate GlcNAc-1-phosphate transferase